MLGSLREACRTHTQDAIDALVAALAEGGSTAVAAARVLLAYGYGQPPTTTEDETPSTTPTLSVGEAFTSVGLDASLADEFTPPQ